MKSPKQIHLETELLRMVPGASPPQRQRAGGRQPGKPQRQRAGVALRAAEILLHDREIQSLQEYANTVSIKRLGFNDHGPVHMRTVVINALIMAGLLHEAGTKLSLEQDEVDIDLEEEPTPGYGLVNLRGGIRWRQWRTQLVLENLLDRTYSEHFSYQRDPFRSGTVVPEPGRRVVLTLGWSL